MENSEERAAPNAADATAVVLTLLAVLRVVWVQRHYGLLGPDTYPLIYAGRIESVGDWLASFAEPLMGTTLGGIYWRPLVQLSLGFDHLLFGLEPLGYQVVNALVYGATGLAVYALAVTLFRGARTPGPIVALVLFLLHPVHAAVLPVPSRRGEMLCLFFMTLALAVQARFAAGGRRRTTWLPAGLLAMALASKETAFLLPGLCAVVAYTMASGASRERLFSAARAVGPQLLVVLVVVAMRVAVLGGVVGDRPLAGADDAARMLFGMIGRILAGLIASPPQLAWLTGALAGVTVTSVLVGVALARSRPRSFAAKAGPTVLLALAWLAAISAFYTVGSLLQPWYLLGPVAAFALLLGGVVQGLVGAQGASSVARFTSRVGLASLAGLILLVASGSPLLREYPAWARAELRRSRYLDQLRHAITAAPDGSVLRASEPPVVLQGQPDAPIDVVPIAIADYSVLAWAALAFPERSIRVARARDLEASPSPAPDELFIVLERRGRGRVRNQRR